jgi:hypothetical protein
MNVNMYDNDTPLVKPKYQKNFFPYDIKNNFRKIGDERIKEYPFRSSRQDDSCRLFFYLKYESVNSISPLIARGEIM